jgi:glycosyltransferase involved in cell wall biosynthesis
VGRDRARSRSEWDGLIVLCAASKWESVKLADRHMAESLAAHAPLLYVDPPISHLTRFKKSTVGATTERPRLKVMDTGFARFTPVVAPKPMHPAMVGVTSRLVQRQLRQVVRRLDARVQAIVSTWLFVDVYGALDERRRVYWWLDDPAGAAAYWGESAERLSQADERLGRASDLVVAVTDGAVRRWEERAVPAVHLPNGCDAAFFAGVDELQPPADVRLRGPIAGVVGHINSRTDLALLEAVANTGIGLLLIGPKDPDFEPERFDRLTARENVQHVGPKRFEQLPAYLKAIDVGLVPYGHTEFNRHSFPMKALEYLAAGRPVVATSLPAMKWLKTDLIALADAPDAFAASVAGEAARARDPILIRRRREFASTHSWEQRAARLADLLGAAS